MYGTANNLCYSENILDPFIGVTLVGGGNKVRTSSEGQLHKCSKGLDRPEN